MKLEEITIERVKESYEKTGLKPGKFKTPGCACALQTLAKEVLGSERYWFKILDYEDDDSLTSFTHGFDFPEETKRLEWYNGERLEAFLKGQEIAKALGL